MPRADAMAPRGERQAAILKFHRLSMATDFSAWCKLSPRTRGKTIRSCRAFPGLDAEFIGRESLFGHGRAGAVAN
jgi:hypothetical protein